MNKYLIVLAAGKGSRMKSLIGDHTKISYPIMGKPILEYVLDAVDPIGFDEKYVIAGFGGEITKQIVGNRAKTIKESKVTETASSVNMARDDLENKEGITLVIYGDLPLITTESLNKLFKKHEKNKNSLTVMTSVVEHPEGYARIIREHKSNVISAIKEEAKCNEYELMDVNEINPGIYLFNNKILFEYLKKGIYTISEIVEKLVKDKIKVETYVLEDATEIFSINNRVQLAYAAKIIRKRVNHKLMLSGVSIEDPDTAYISPDVIVNQDTIIMPNTTILGKSRIGRNNLLGPNLHLVNASIGNDNTISYSWIEDSKIGNKNKVGPYTKITNNSEIGDNCEVDSFIELDSANIKNGSKVKK